MRRRLGIVVAAMIVASQLGTPAAPEQPTLDQLALMAEYLEENNIEALRAFLLLHPELLEGDTPLAGELRRFMDETESLSDYLAFEPDLRDAIDPTPTAPLIDEGSSLY
jgi:hypothetical protein